jgi:hypothetical protein
MRIHVYTSATGFELSKGNRIADGRINCRDVPRRLVEIRDRGHRNHYGRIERGSPWDDSQQRDIGFA